MSMAIKASVRCIARRRRCCGATERRPTLVWWRVRAQAALRCKPSGRFSSSNALDLRGSYLTSLESLDSQHRRRLLVTPQKAFVTSRVISIIHR